MLNMIKPIRVPVLIGGSNSVYRYDSMSPGEEVFGLRLVEQFPWAMISTAFEGCFRINWKKS